MFLGVVVGFCWVGGRVFFISFWAIFRSFLVFMFRANSLRFSFRYSSWRGVSFIIFSPLIALIPVGTIFVLFIFIMVVGFSPRFSVSLRGTTVTSEGLSVL